MEEVMEAFLAQLGYLVENKEQEKGYERFSAPIHNSGTCYETPMFVMRSYCWDEEGPFAHDANFDCPKYGVSCTWYKYYTRGLHVQIDPTITNEAEHLCDMFIDCLKSINDGYEINRTGDKVCQ